MFLSRAFCILRLAAVDVVAAGGVRVALVLVEDVDEQVEVVRRGLCRRSVGGWMRLARPGDILSALFGLADLLVRKVEDEELAVGDWEELDWTDVTRRMSAGSGCE